MINKPTQLEIEQRMNRCDLSHELNFVVKHFELYKKIHLPCSHETYFNEWYKNLEIVENKNAKFPQTESSITIMALQQIPKLLLQNSRLKTIDYTYANSVIVPAFDNNGFLDFSRVKFVKETEFPSDNHPTRILVGYSKGSIILPTCIPKTISENSLAIAYYQMHVLIHEFCHTLKFSKTLLNDFWNAFLVNQQCVSMYAENYKDDLTERVRLENSSKWEYAINEQLAECFVAYIFNIVPNYKDWTDFKSCLPKYWQIMNDLFTTSRYF